MLNYSRNRKRINRAPCPGGPHGLERKGSILSACFLAPAGHLPEDFSPGLRARGGQGCGQELSSEQPGLGRWEGPSLPLGSPGFLGQGGQSSKSSSPTAPLSVQAAEGWSLAQRAAQPGGAGGGVSAAERPRRQRHWGVSRSGLSALPGSSYGRAPAVQLRSRLFFRGVLPSIRDPCHQPQRGPPCKGAPQEVTCHFWDPSVRLNCHSRVLGGDTLPAGRRGGSAKELHPVPHLLFEAPLRAIRGVKPTMAQASGWMLELSGSPGHPEQLRAAPGAPGHHTGG